MHKERRRARLKTVRRVYPIYSASSSELTDNEDKRNDIVEVRSVKIYQRPRKQHPTNFEIQEPIVTYVVAGHRKPPLTQISSESKTQSEAINSDGIPTISSAALKTTEPSENKSSVCNHRCLRIFLIILAIFILIISMLLLAFSLNLLLNPNMTKIRSVAIIYPQALPSSGFTGKGPTDTLLVAAILGIVLSSVILIVSLGVIICLICIDFRRYRCACFTGPILLLIIFVILLGLAIFVMVVGDTELQRLATSTQTTVYYYYNSTSTTLVRDGWDFVQYYFGCCGIKANNTDWYPAPSTGWQFNSILPRSCCGYDSNDIGHAGRIFVGTSVPTLIGFCYFGDIGQPTCYDSIKTNLLITVLVFLIGLALIVLILAILFIVLLFIYRNLHQHT